MHILKRRRRETNLAGDCLDLFWRVGRVQLDSTQSRPSVSSSIIYSDVLEIKRLWVRVDEKGSLNLAPLTLAKTRPESFLYHFHTIIFFLYHFWPGTVHAATVKSWFHRITVATFKSSQPKTSFTVFFFFFFFWPCNLFPFFWSSMVPTQKCSGAQRKEVNEFELPFERRKLSLLGLHLIRCGCCLRVSHSHHRKSSSPMERGQRVSLSSSPFPPDHLCP